LRPLITDDSVTTLGAEARGAVVVAGSHAGVYPARWLAALGIAAVVLNDASGGREGAGVAGLDLLDACGVPATAVSHLSARIGDGRDCLERGVLSHVNKQAAGQGCLVGESCHRAVERLRGGRWATALTGGASPGPESRHLLATGMPEVWAVDSAALLRPQDAGQILLTGSHGGLLGGRAASAAKAPVRAIVYNDAGIGIDDAGIGRLAALDERDIVAATVSAASARIGDGLSTYGEGILSAVNRSAAALGIAVGLSARDFVTIVSINASGNRP
jgi:hypothetical protein